MILTKVAVTVLIIVILILVLWFAKECFEAECAVLGIPFVIVSILLLLLIFVTWHCDMAVSDSNAQLHMISRPGLPPIMWYD